MAELIHVQVPDRDYLRLTRTQNKPRRTRKPNCTPPVWTPIDEDRLHALLRRAEAVVVARLPRRARSFLAVYTSLLHTAFFYQGECRPCLERIGRECRPTPLSVTTVKDALRFYEEQGMLRRHARWRDSDEWPVQIGSGIRLGKARGVRANNGYSFPQVADLLLMPRPAAEHDVPVTKDSAQLESKRKQESLIPPGSPTGGPEKKVALEVARRIVVAHHDQRRPVAAVPGDLLQQRVIAHAAQQRAFYHDRLRHRGLLSTPPPDHPRTAGGHDATPRPSGNDPAPD